MKVLNLYAGIGGNRKLWDDVDVTAVEWDEETAKVYQDYFPDDEVIIADAHQYLLDHFNEYDFIWSSPPCQSHSRLRMIDAKGVKKQYPDMRIYQEIIFLDKFFNSKWAVENVIPYYKPLIPAKKHGRHLFWTNFKTGTHRFKCDPPHITASRTSRYEKRTHYESFFGFDLNKYKIPAKKKRQLLVNCLNPEIGKYILDRARDIVTKTDTNQSNLFEI